MEDSLIPLPPLGDGLKDAIIYCFYMLQSKIIYRLRYKSKNNFI